MQVIALTLGAFRTNTYLVWGEQSDTCVVIDPGYYPEQILAAVQQHGKSVSAIILTHGHFDHCGAAEELVERTGCQLWMHQNDWTPDPHPVWKQLYPLAGCTFPPVRLFREGDQISLSGVTFRVLETPGHTRGSVCLIAGKVMFTGDTLFRGSCGRSNLPGGDPVVIQNSLRRLAQLEGNYTLYPGHSDSSTLDTERMDNPYLQ